MSEPIQPTSATPNTIKMVDDDPHQVAPAPQAAPQSQALNPNVLLNNAIDGFAGIGSKINPFAQKISKSLGQARQYAQEKLGTAEEVTELPQEYKDLENRVDTLRNVQANLVKLTRTYASPSYDYPAQLQESLLGITSSVTREIQNMTLSTADRSNVVDPLAEQRQHPKTLSHALARVAAQGAEQIGVEDHYGTALFKVSTITEKVGNAQLAMDDAITTRFTQPMQTNLATVIEQALKARRIVQSTRLALDTVKARYKTTRPDKEEANRLEVEEAENQFVAAVEEATSMMKAALDNPEPYRNLADLVAAQSAYHKEAHELLSELTPELDALRVAQESHFHHD
ncbi:hypothetical protein CLU79DRAFT_778566 [Phycomyces nitens]|nr:hypothetical protein CLU79DRAFT_778566 [Phycomyces nitens]